MRSLAPLMSTLTWTRHFSDEFYCKLLYREVLTKGHALIFMDVPIKELGSSTDCSSNVHFINID